MYYELYVDTLFLVNFVMNLYLLMLANISVGRTATRLRIIAASALGALLYVVALVIPVLPVFIRLIVQTTVTVLLMIRIAFNPKSLTGYRKLLENIIGYSFLLGGGLYMISQYTEGLSGHSTGIALAMGGGGLIYMFVSYVVTKRRYVEESCIVTLFLEQREVKVKAILDTGNGLCEPISKAPVSVVSKSVAEALWPEGMPDLFRAIPYHSVGCNRGIMPGYLISEMTVVVDGIPNKIPPSYIAVSEQNVSAKGNYEMILNPRALGK